MATSTTFKLIEVANTDAAETVSIQSAADAGEGAEIVVKDTSAGGAGTNNITVTPESGTIDGSASATIASDGGGMFLRSDGIQWLNIGGGGGLSGHAIEDEGTPLTQRSTINFVGTGVAATDAGGKTVVTVTAAAAPTTPALIYHPADVLAALKAYNGSAVNQATTGSPISVGVMYYALRDLVCTGVRYYWVRGSADRAPVVKLWLNSAIGAGTVLASKATATTATGIYTGTFDTPVNIPAGSVFTTTVFDVLDYTSANIPGDASYPYLGAYDGGTRKGEGMAGPGVLILAHRFATDTDTIPTINGSSAGLEMFGVEPILNNITVLP